LLEEKYTIQCRFRTTVTAFKLGAIVAPRCSNAVQVEGTGDSLEQEYHLTWSPYWLHALHGHLGHGGDFYLPPS
jgi:hypothetical protein